MMLVSVGLGLSDSAVIGLLYKNKITKFIKKHCYDLDYTSDYDIDYNSNTDLEGDSDIDSNYIE